MAAGDRGVADEATAEAFARLLAYRERVRDPVAWVFRTAFGVAAKELGRRTMVANGAVAVGVVSDVSVLPPDLTSALRRLSLDQRVEVFLHYFEDMSVGEVARLTG
jgi:DNA-directed RNA polymerase specialized sigma24 family protein